MRNLFFIDYQDRYLLNNKIEQIIKEQGEFEIVKYDFKEDNVLDILNDIVTIPLLDAKCIILDDFTLLADKKENPLTKNFIDAFYSDNDNLLIITFSGKATNTALLSVIKEVGKTIVLKELVEKDFESFVLKRFEEDGYKFDPSLASELVIKCDNNLSIINSEIDKLELLKIESKVITYQDLALVSDNAENNIYDLLNAFINNDKKRLLEIYQNFINLNTDELFILNRLISAIEEILYVKILVNNNASKDDIADYFDVKKGKAYYMMKNATMFKEEKLKEMIKKLNQLDFNIKSGYIDKKTGLELFILGA